MCLCCQFFILSFIERTCAFFTAKHMDNFTWQIFDRNIRHFRQLQISHAYHHYMNPPSIHDVVTHESFHLNLGLVCPALRSIIIKKYENMYFVISLQTHFIIHIKRISILALLVVIVIRTLWWRSNRSGDFIFSFFFRQVISMNRAYFWMVGIPEFYVRLPNDINKSK